MTELSKTETGDQQNVRKFDAENYNDFIAYSHILARIYAKSNNAALLKQLEIVRE